MKEICKCNCSRGVGLYKTPWCELLCKSNRDSGEVLHLWYKLEWLRHEVEKRSSYLGKFRRTEEAKHLLDLISMTDDEKDLFYPFAKAAMADVFDALQLYAPKHEKGYWWREGQTTVVIDSSVAYEEPVTFSAGDYVIYDGLLYVAVMDGDSDDVTGKLLPTEDYRDSIHYGLLWYFGDNINIVDPLDTAIFEALVARIIYKWLQYSYPDEASRYLVEYEENLSKIKTRVAFLQGTPIVHRIPRMF